MTRDEYQAEFNKQLFKTKDDLIVFLQNAIVKIFDEQEKTVKRIANESLVKELTRVDELSQMYIREKLNEEHKLISEQTDKYCKTLEEAAFNAIAAKQKECDDEIAAYKKKISELEEQLKDLRL